MLVLTRKCGEAIVIDGDIEICITDISADKVRIGINAPAHMKVYRKELADTIQENRSAAAVSDTRSLRELFSKLD